MIDIIDHIGSVSGIDDAVYSSTDMGGDCTEDHIPGKIPSCN